MPLKLAAADRVQHVPLHGRRRADIAGVLAPLAEGLVVLHAPLALSLDRTGNGTVGVIVLPLHWTGDAVFDHHVPVNASGSAGLGLPRSSRTSASSSPSRSVSALTCSAWVGTYHRPGRVTVAL